MNPIYRDLGRVANAQEARSCAMTKGSDGKWYFVILSSGFVVSVDLHTAKSVADSGCCKIQKFFDRIRKGDGSSPMNEHSSPLPRV